MQLDFDEKRHAFAVDMIAPKKVSLFFGEKYCFVAMTSGLNIAGLEAEADGGGIFNGLAAFECIHFEASCVVWVSKKDAPHMTLRDFTSKFEFGFVQGLASSSAVVEYWGKFPAHGRSRLISEWPGSWEVDTSQPTKPWTKIEPRATVAATHSASPDHHAFKVSTSFNDGPLYMVAHTRDAVPDSTFMGSVKHYLRSVFLRRQFTTVLCAREKASGDFTPISATDWEIRHEHSVSYKERRGAPLERTVTGPDGNFPSGGSPSVINDTHRRLLAMAKKGSPFVFPETFKQRFGSAKEETDAVNRDFVQSFWTSDTA